MSADATPELPESLDDEAAALEAELAEAEMDMDGPSPYEQMTERLSVYAVLLPTILPPIGQTKSPEGGDEPKVNRDVRRYRDFALAAIFADIRRIAGDGIAFQVSGEDAK